MVIRLESEIEGVNARKSETDWMFGALSVRVQVQEHRMLGAVIDILVANSETRYLPSPYGTTYADGLEGIELES